MALDFDGTVNAVLAHCVAAGAALTNPIVDVAYAHPLPRGRCIRIFYGGEAEPAHMGSDARVLNGQMVAELIRIVAFWPLSSSGETMAATVEAEVRALKHQIRTRILGDSQLGGLSTDLALSNAITDFGANGGIVYRTLEYEITTDYDEYAIAP